MIESKKDFYWPNNWIGQSDIESLKAIFSACFSGISSDEYYQKYFEANSAFKRSLRLYYASGKVVGYCLLTFEHQQGKVLIRASAGFYSEYRQGGNTLSFSIREAFKYWVTHPWQRVYYADTMLSPAMYRAIAKRVAITYPSEKHCSARVELFEQFNPNGTHSELTQTRCLVNAGRSSSYSNQEVASFLASDKAEINFYCRANPEFTSGIALFVIMPVNFKQLVLTLFNKA